MVALGNFLFHHRNKLFPLFYALLFLPSPPLLDGGVIALMWVGFFVSGAGQGIRVGTIGLRYIIRGGRRGRVYAEDLVTEGIFAHARNPLYVGNILILMGLGVMANSLLFHLAGVPLFLLMYHAIVRAEEDFLEGKFGAAYLRYTRDVNRWIPHLRGLNTTFAEMEFHWKRVLIREYTTTYLWLSAAVLIVMKNLAAHGSPLYLEHRAWGLALLGALLLLYIVTRTLKRRGVITA